MYRRLLTRSRPRRGVHARLFVVAVLLAVSPPANGWADAIALTAHTSIQGFALVEDTIRSGADAQTILANFSEGSSELGPITLSRVAGGIPDPQLVGGELALAAGLATTITSVVRPTEIHVSGSTRAGAIAQIPAGSFITSSDAHANASAGFTASFALTAPHLFDTSLVWDVVDRGGAAAIASARLVDVMGGDIFRREFTGDSVSSVGALHGTLEPGSYSLFVSLFSGAFASAFEGRKPTDSESGQSVLDLGFALTPAATPEPASVLLLGSGLVVLAGRTWKRRRRPT